MTTHQFLELLGYIASGLVVISMLMNSILKLRIVNLIGSTMFSIYGFLIHSIPVGFVNAFIAAINIYYLTKMFTHKEFFKTLPIRGNNLYLKELLNFYKNDLKKYFPDFKYEPEKNKYSFFILRNMYVAGIFMARHFKDNMLLITLDFATPQYRDFKVGKFIYTSYAKQFISDGYNTLVTYSPNKVHQKYLHKMGFKKQTIDNKTFFVKHLQPR
jgi:hypothetical protein